MDLSLHNLKDLIRSKYDWKFILLGSASRTTISDSEDQRTFFLGLGRSKVYQFRTNARQGSNPWQKIDETKIKFELPAGKQ